MGQMTKRLAGRRRGFPQLRVAKHREEGLPQTNVTLRHCLDICIPADFAAR
jgi:hypothetical protein